MSNLEGAMLSDYLLLECISQGNVADIYRATQEKSDQYEVAIKIFRPSYALREAFRAYFMYEAEKIGRFDHPHILPFIEYGEGEGLLYSVTPFVRSGTLRDLLERIGGKLSARQALPLVQQLCDAVQYAHERDVIHSNIKPGNVFVANDGRMLLADFGIARGYSTSPQSLSKLDWSATEYAAPEQSLGLLRRSGDIYSLGSLFFRLLTGSVPFTGQTPVDVLLKHVRFDPPHARSIEPALSEEIDAILLKALSKRSDDRYATAAELGYAFAEAVRGNSDSHPGALTTRPLSSEPRTPVPVPSEVSTALQSALVPMISWPSEGMTGAIVLPEQHGSTETVRREEQVVSDVESSREFVPSSAFSSVELIEVEWSPIGPSVATSGPAGQLVVTSVLSEMSEPAGKKSSLLPPLHTRREQKPVEIQQEKRKLLLPLLVLILLLLGLFGALLSSFLLPAPHRDAGPGFVSALVICRDCLAHSFLYSFS